VSAFFYHVDLADFNTFRRLEDTCTLALFVSFFFTTSIYLDFLGYKNFVLHSASEIVFLAFLPFKNTGSFVPCVCIGT